MISVFAFKLIGCRLSVNFPALVFQWFADYITRFAAGPTTHRCSFDFVSFLCPRFVLIGLKLVHEVDDLVILTRR